MFTGQGSICKGSGGCLPVCLPRGRRDADAAHQSQQCWPPPRLAPGEGDFSQDSEHDKEQSVQLLCLFATHPDHTSPVSLALPSKLYLGLYMITY